jgi:hypothetical protein
VAGEILDRALPLPVLILDGLLEHAGAVRPRPFEPGVHVCHAHLDQVRHDARLRWLLLTTDVGDDHPTVVAHLHLGAVILSDTDPLGEVERRGEPGDGLSHVGIHQYGNHGGVWNRTVAEHPGTLRVECHWRPAEGYGAARGGYDARNTDEGEHLMTDLYTYRMDVFTAEPVDLTGYDVEATDGHIGKVDESTLDAGGSYLVVDTGFWIFGKKRMIPAAVVTRVDPDSKNVYVAMTKDQIKSAPDFDEARTASEMRADQESYYRQYGA